MLAYLPVDAQSGAYLECIARRGVARVLSTGRLLSSQHAARRGRATQDGLTHRTVLPYVLGYGLEHDINQLPTIQALLCSGLVLRVNSGLVDDPLFARDFVVRSDIR